MTISRVAFLKIILPHICMSLLEAGTRIPVRAVTLESAMQAIMQHDLDPGQVRVSDADGWYGKRKTRVLHCHRTFYKEKCLKLVFKL